MSLEADIYRTQVKVDELMESGYTRQEAVLLIQAAAMSRLYDCITSDYNGKDYFRIGGQVATYKQ